MRLSIETVSEYEPLKFKIPNFKSVPMTDLKKRKKRMQTNYWF